MESQFTGLSTEIQQFIASEADKDTENYDPSVNDPCLVRVKEMWHRATVLERDELNWNVSDNVMKPAGHFDFCFYMSHEVKKKKLFDMKVYRKKSRLI